MKISLICAMATNGVIGRNNGLPWHLPEDLRYFKATTMGHAIIMGRKTWESIGRPLPGRTSIVVTGNSSYHADGAKVVHSVQQAVRVAQALADIRVHRLIGNPFVPCCGRCRRAFAQIRRAIRRAHNV